MIESPREFTDKDKRVFGLVLGGLLGFAAFHSWRKGGIAWPALSGLGAVSTLVALTAPAAFTTVLGAWMRAARLMAAVNTNLFMALLWTLIFTPFGLLRRVFKIDHLNIGRAAQESYWRAHKVRNVDAYRRLF